MKQKYQKVPEIITGKDLDYLSDMFNWNYGAYKSYSNAISKIQDDELKGVMQKAINTFKTNIKTVMSILEGGQNG